MSSELQINWLVQESCNSIANALELRIPCTNTSKWYVISFAVKTYSQYINSLRPSDTTCFSNIISIGSNNGLAPGQRQAIIWTNAGVLLIGPLGTNFSEILIKTHVFSFKKMHLKLSSVW